MELAKLASASSIERSQGVLDKAKQDKREKIKEAAQDFESLFLNIVLEKMRKTVEKSGLIDGGNAEDIYRSMLDQEYAKIMSQENFTGLSAMIEKQLLGQDADFKALGKKEALKNYGQQMKMSVVSKPKGVR